MRTVILLGSIIIASAIGIEPPYDDKFTALVATVLIVAMAFDVIEFFVEITK
jgi:hypothetical protein